MKNSVLILWLEGVSPEELSAIPALEKLSKGGVDIQLTPLPIMEKSNCYYQTLTGMGSGKFGRFDSVRAERYSVLEDASIPEGSRGRLLPDILRSRKLAVSFLEARDLSVFDALPQQAGDCTMIRFAASNVDSATLETLIQRCAELSTPDGHLCVLTDVWDQPPGKYVNVNDFLADVGLLEVGEPRKRTGIVWSETLAYGIGRGQLWINLKGREAQGNVRSGSEYQEVRDALINELSTNWRDPQTGEAIVEQVLKKEEAYTGEYLFKAPDLVVVYRPGYAPSPGAVALDFDGVSVGDAESTAHTCAPRARLIATGPSLAKGIMEKASLVDVMPSVLYLLGQPIPMDVDGDVITWMFTPAYRQQTPVTRLNSDEALLSDEEEDMIVDRLRDLGYLG